MGGSGWGLMGDDRMAAVVLCAMAVAAAVVLPLYSK